MTQFEKARPGRGANRLPKGAALLSATAGILMLGSIAARADCGDSAAPGVDWHGCDKQLIQLDGSDLNGANLSDVDFTSTALRDSNLLAANLEKATLVRASLAGSKAKGANFSRIEAYRTNFSNLDAQGAVFASGEMQRSQFKDANLVNADFTKAELGRAQFDGANISGAKFALANLARVDFRSSKFDGIDFAGAFFFLVRLEGVDVSKATGLAQWQIDMACGDAKTVLPQGLKPGSSWPCQFEQE